MNWSAAKLVKQSASQSAFLIFKKLESAKTPRMYTGNIHASKIVQKEEASEELRGTISLPEGNLYFCIDMFKNNIATEIKMIEGIPEDWYFQSCLLQCSLYATLLKDVRYLDTPTFRKKEGFAEQFVDLDKPVEYRLLFGKELYTVDPSEIIKTFYFNKLRIIHKTVTNPKFDLYECKKFDAKYKFKEFEHLKQYIKYKKIKQ